LFPGKYILVLVLLISTLDMNAQNDTLKKSDTSNLKVAVFKKDFINSRIELSNHLISSYNHKLYNPDIYKLENTHDLIITSWPYPNILYSNYSQYSLKYSLYKIYDPLNPLLGRSDPTNPWYDPTNPSGATSAGDFLIFGTLNYLFSKVVTGE
jgi:hypothetical protein